MTSTERLTGNAATCYRIHVDVEVDDRQDEFEFIARGLPVPPCTGETLQFDIAPLGESLTLAITRVTHWISPRAHNGADHVEVVLHAIPDASPVAIRLLDHAELERWVAQFDLLKLG